MNIAEVTSRFALLSGIDNERLFKWKPLIEDACAYVESISTIKTPSIAQTKRLEMLSAVYALKLYSRCGDEKITSFTAGDVTIASSANGAASADELWKEYLSESSDIVDAGSDFLFGRVI